MVAATGQLAPPRRIPVNGRPIRLRWLQQIIWFVVVANVGAWIMSAQTRGLIRIPSYSDVGLDFYLKPDWDHLFSFQGWAEDRHDVRNVYEAVLATLFVRSLMANWKKHDRRAPGWYVAISPIVIVVAAFPVVVAGIWLINYGLPDVWHFALSHHVLRNPVHFPHRLDWFGTYLSGYPWQPVLIGILAGQVVHRVYAPAGNTVQLYFIGRSVDKTRDAIHAGEENPYRHLPRWPWPPVIRERAAWIMANQLPVPNRTFDIRLAVRIVTVVLAALAIYGAYVRYVIAKGHSA